MLQRCDRLYQDLIRELANCREEKLSFLTETEQCFYIAEKYRLLLRNEVAGHIFSSVDEEVSFFKLIKPKFVAESEYASLLNFAGNFGPDTDQSADKRQFWLRQVYRLERFKNTHNRFFQYYTSNQIHLDCVHFTSYNPAGVRGFFDKTRNDYDLLIGKLKARERYAEYAAKELEKLGW